MSRYERWVESTGRVLDALALAFLVALVLEWLFPHAPSWLHRGLNAVTWLVWLAFALDYVVRFWLSEHKWPFVRSHPLDLLMVAVPMLRMLRVALVLRKSVKAVKTQRIAESLLIIIAVFVFLGAVVEWRVESVRPDSNIKTFGDSLWWAMETTTTVGYGDYYPVTTAGRIIATLVMLVGIGLIGTVSASVASWFVNRRQAHRSVSSGTATAAPGTGEPAAASPEPIPTPGEAPTTPAGMPALLQRLDALSTEQAEIRRLLEKMSTPA